MNDNWTPDLTEQMARQQLGLGSSRPSTFSPLEAEAGRSGFTDPPRLSPQPTPAERVAELDAIMARQREDDGLRAVDTPRRAAVMAAISAAGMCWSDPAGAGVWDTEGCRAVAAWLLRQLGTTEVPLADLERERKRLAKAQAELRAVRVHREPEP